MRRQFSRPPRKRQMRPLTGRKAVQRHAPWQARKAGPWPLCVKSEAVGAAIAKSRNDGPLS